MAAERTALGRTKAVDDWIRAARESSPGRDYAIQRRPANEVSRDAVERALRDLYRTR